MKWDVYLKRDDGTLSPNCSAVTATTLVDAQRKAQEILEQLQAEGVLRRWEVHTVVGVAPMIHTIEEIKARSRALNKKKGGKPGAWWFSAGNMRFFSSRVSSRCVSRANRRLFHNVRAI